MSPEYKKGFDEAIDRVIVELRRQASDYARLETEDNCTCKKWHYRVLALIDFKLYLEQLFKMYVVES